MSVTFSERTLRVGDTTIAFKEAGTGPAVVQIHGAGGARVTPAHALLAERYRVIVPELPGFGTTPDVADVRTARDLARVMLTFVAAVAPDRPSLIGTSFGGKVALWMTIDAPDRIATLILESSAAIRPADHDLSKIPPSEMPARVFAHPERVTLPPDDPAVRARNGAAVGRLIGPNRDADFERHLSGVHVPTLVLFGDRDGLIPTEMGRIYREKMPSAQFVIVYDAAHQIQIDRPEAFAEIVGDFLERQETFIINRSSSLVLT
ncbi:MAG TPA: alpha/beta hydrolase [Candidatus Limnocylindria bacterium]|nr:alpha/beta hydrolase [Candidatus Limnocylindria bacterium]